jgi:C-8 sterol isomerase
MNRYVFSPEVLHGVAKEAIASRPTTEGKVELIRSRLMEIYPGHVRPENEWVFNIAGGSMGHMTILHASINEYVIIFGTPIGTEGYSGRFAADDYFMILEGEQWAYDEATQKKEIFRPGDLHVMPRGVARGYRMPDHCYALEYARGLVPAMLPFGLADSFTSTMDMRNVAKTIKIYARATLSEWATQIKETISPPAIAPRASQPEIAEPTRTNGATRLSA